MAAPSIGGLPPLRRARRGVLGYLIREGTAIVFSGLLVFVFYSGYEPRLDTPDAAMWHVFWAAFLALAYTSLHAFSAATVPLGAETLPLIDILVSFVPLIVIIYTAVEWLRGQQPLSTYQIIVLILATMAALTDTVVFTWFTLRINRLAREFVPMD